MEVMEEEEGGYEPITFGGQNILQDWLKKKAKSKKNTGLSGCFLNL